MNKVLITATLLTTVVGLAVNTKYAFAANLERGKTLARQCSVCNGKIGVSTDPEVPNLAGQSAFYLEKSLKDFQSGAREDRRMTLIVQPLTPEDIKDLAAWYESFVVTVTPPAD